MYQRTAEASVQSSPDHSCHQEATSVPQEQGRSHLLVLPLQELPQGHRWQKCHPSGASWCLAAITAGPLKDYNSGSTPWGQSQPGAVLPADCSSSDEAIQLSDRCNLNHLPGSHPVKVVELLWFRLFFGGGSKPPTWELRETAFKLAGDWRGASSQQQQQRAGPSRQAPAVPTAVTGRASQNNPEKTSFLLTENVPISKKIRYHNMLNFLGVNSCSLGTWLAIPAVR